MKKIYFLLLGLFLFSGVNAQIITVPDANFKAKLLAANSSNTIAKNLAGTYFKIDADNNGEIEVSEALQVSYLNVDSMNTPDNVKINSLSGISNFTNLLNLSCADNLLTSLDLNNLTNLKNLFCPFNLLTSLDLSFNSVLEFLNCGNNQIVNLNVNGLGNLISLNFGNNQVSSVNMSALTSLVSLYCYENNLTELIISNLSSLHLIRCSSNLITTVQLTGLTNLEELTCTNNNISNLVLNNTNNITTLKCGFNQLTTLNVNLLTSLTTLECDHNNLLTTLFIKNGRNESVSFYSNPNLQYICYDDSQMAAIQSHLNSYGYINCQSNSYCSFTPGGTFYSVQGNTKLDYDSNGCDSNDVNFSNLKFNISNGVIATNFISNVSGNYNMPLIQGAYTVTPFIENPTYFTISPSTVNVTFPTQASPFTQNFCVTANGVHPDLEVTLLPIVRARPGFDAKYKIIYKNKGNQVQSGSVNLAFNDAVLDLITANPVVSNQSVNNLSWNFTNLLPFETREIALTLNVNSPMESPAVNNGDILNYTTSIVSAATDDMPNDNTFAFNQTVVGSYDPNDKTCLEGATIAPAKVGDYVHYMIRFENTGTYPAQNIVVKDMIDLTKFDISTLVPIKGSHSFVTNITSGNKVEFIFENINLPFDDANNDGYVTFKIKTKPTLVVGNTFSNTASIYFDYNFPIVTNTATTTIAVLANQDFVFSNYFTLYPNPVKDILNITAKETIEVTSINIYNTLGQLVLVIPNAQNTKTVDVSGLTKGNYFIKINSDKGTSNTKFIKN